MALSALPPHRCHWQTCGVLPPPQISRPLASLLLDPGDGRMLPESSVPGLVSCAAPLSHGAGANLSGSPPSLVVGQPCPGTDARVRPGAALVQHAEVSLKHWPWRFSNHLGESNSLVRGNCVEGHRQGNFSGENPDS